MKKLFCLLLAVLSVLGMTCCASADAMPYSKVYEPVTSWPLAATVAWRADAGVLDTAGSDVRPATVFVWLDADLKVYDRDGGLISDDLEAYAAATAPVMIPAFCIRDAQTAAALKEYLKKGILQDCFVVSDPEHRELVKDVADLVHVRGMLDYTAAAAPDRDALLEMAASVNGAHGKVILLSSEAATRENVKLLQSLASTVWVQSPADTKTLAFHYTNGVNGVLVDDYAAAFGVMEKFSDDAPSLLRVPLIIGHRGMPSMFVENTLYSALGAFAAGADSVENDIQLSADGEIFILHDDSPARLLGITNVDMAEKLTMEELRSHPFVWDDPSVGVLQKNNQPAAGSRYGVLIGSEKLNVVPTLREYIETFKGTGLIHDTEIKSYDPAILAAYKELVDSYDAWDQFFTITFNTVILDAVYADYPEISIGALGIDGYASYPGMPSFDNYGRIAAKQGAEAALQQLCGELDKWNATYNPYLNFSYDVVSAGRHRGLTVWPWTYNDPQSFAEAYLNGIYGITTNWAWWATDYVVEISAGDVKVSDIGKIPRPVGTTRIGSAVPLPDAEPVILEEYPDKGETLMVWRWRAEMNVAGENLGYCYLYSNPFTVKLGK
ncbi:MAG: hypothetical protein J5564_04345 [Clostridia bacterium]|nr:hypothetical protein [Clostridia bacterium]